MGKIIVDDLFPERQESEDKSFQVTIAKKGLGKGKYAKCVFEITQQTFMDLFGGNKHLPKFVYSKLVTGSDGKNTWQDYQPET